MIKVTIACSLPNKNSPKKLIGSLLLTNKMKENNAVTEKYNGDLTSNALLPNPNFIYRIFHNS